MKLDKKTIMSLFIALIMIVSVMGFAFNFMTPAQVAEYEGRKFSSTGNGWQAKMAGTKMTFLNHPAELESIQAGGNAAYLLQNSRAVWFTYDPNDIEAETIADALYYAEQNIGIAGRFFVQKGLTNNTGYALPETSCANATTTVPVLLMQSGNETRIDEAQGCMTATAENRQDAYRLSDRLFYIAAGVMAK